MSRHINQAPPKPPKPKPDKSPHLAAKLPNDPRELFTHCTASWTGLQPLTVVGAMFENIVPTPATITVDLKAINDALSPAEGGDAVPVENLRVATDALHATWTLVTKFCEHALRGVPAARIPPILAQILMTPSGVGHNRPAKAPIAVKQLGPGMVRIDVLALSGVIAYFYEYSIDQINWIAGAQTGRTDGSISGLKPGTLHYFRFRCLKTDDAYTSYSHVISMFVAE